MKVFNPLVAIVLLFSIESFAKDFRAAWYQGLNDPPGASIKEYAENKLLPVEFLESIGLQNKPDFKMKIEGIQPNGNEANWGIQVDVAAEKLTFPQVISIPYYMPAAGAEGEVWDRNFNFRTKPWKLVKDGKLVNMGMVLRVTMSHKKPDKSFRFFDQLSKYDRKSDTGKNICGSRKKSADQTAIPYGLWRLAEARQQKRIFLVEGESSAQTLWYHGLPALSFGGATKWHDNYIKYLDGIDQIYFLMEPDSGGKSLLACLRKISIEEDYLNFSGRVNLVVLGGYGDISDLHTQIFKDLPGLQDPKKINLFNMLFDGFLKESILLNDPGYKINSKDKTVSPSLSYSIKHRQHHLRKRKYTEDVGEGIFTGKPILKGDQSPTGKRYEVEEIVPSATLQDYSRKKNIPVSELVRLGFEDGLFPNSKFGPIFGVKMTTYQLPLGQILPEDKVVSYYRFRTSMDSAQPSMERFPSVLFNSDGTVKKNQMRAFYGLENLPLYQEVKSVYFVEGESDTLTMLHYGFPAIGIPGTAEWNKAWDDIFNDVEKIVVAVEPDTGGEHFMEVLAQGGLKDKVEFIDFTSGGKDPSDLHVELTKGIGKDVEAFYSSKEFEQKRQEIALDFSKNLQGIVRKGVYWRDVKQFFELYKKKRAAFDNEQTVIWKAKHAERDKCGKADGHDCLTHQEVDKKYMPWPYVDFYQAINGQTVKSYYDMGDNIRPLP